MQAGMHTGWQGGRLGCSRDAYRLVGREARMQAGMHTGREAMRHAGMHTGRQGGRQ